MRWKKRTKINPHDGVVLPWTRNDALTVRDLLTSMIVFGRSGSGKTSGSLVHLLRAIVALPQSGGLVLGSKPEDRPMVQAIFDKSGRKLHVFGADNFLRCNSLAYELSKGAHTRNLCSFILTVAETLRRGDAKGGGDDGGFWEQQKERFLYNAIEVIRLATGTVTAPDIQKFIIDAACNIEQIASDSWQKGFHNTCLKKAFDKPKTPIEDHDFGLAADFWLGEYPRMADKTRSSVLASVLGVLHVFNTGIVREMMSGATNITPDVTLSGDWIFVDFAPCQWGDVGNFIAASWKYMVQRAVLRRHATPGDCINVIVADESNQFVNSFDATYLAQCRSHLGCMIYITQGIHSYLSVLKGEGGKHQAEALWTNAGLKIFHALGDKETAEMASNLLGKSLQQFYGGSMAPVENAFDELLGHSRFTGNFSERWEQVLHPHCFINGLRTGGKANGYVTDAFVIKSGEPFANGQNWLKVAFGQEVRDARR